jgi:hypothetical protein
VRQIVAVLALIIGFVFGAEAQAILTGTDSRVGLAPAGTVSVPFSFLVDSVKGEDVLDVVVDNPSAMITLIRPDGVQLPQQEQARSDSLTRYSLPRPVVPR